MLSIKMLRTIHARYLAWYVWSAYNDYSDTYSGPRTGATMPRTPTIRYWSSRKGGGFFTTIKGTQEELALGPNDKAINGPTYQRACRVFLNLMAPRDPADTITFKGLFIIYKRADHPGRVAEYREKQQEL